MPDHGRRLGGAGQGGLEESTLARTVGTHNRNPAVAVEAKIELLIEHLKNKEKELEYLL